METGLVIGFVAVLLVALVFIIIGLTRSRGPSTLEDRLAEFGTLERPPTLEEIELSQPFSQRVLVPLVRKLSSMAKGFTPAETLAATQHKLDLAGNPNNWGPTEFLGIRLLATLLMAALGVALFFVATNVAFLSRLLLVGAVTGLGFFFPVLWLGSKIRNRQKAVIKSLPDALDLLTICVEAGLGFDAAMSRLVEKWEDELSDAFQRVLQEIQLGKLRREALRAMAERIEVTDVTSFVAAIVQAEQLGVSIARVLRIQADQMRVRRRQRAEELARSATIKMLPAIGFLIFPSIFVVLLGPAVITFMTMDIGLTF